MISCCIDQHDQPTSLKEYFIKRKKHGTLIIGRKIKGISADYLVNIRMAGEAWHPLFA